MPNFEVEFYEKPNGEQPARSFLESLDKKMRAKMVSTIVILQKNGFIKITQKTPIGEIEKAKQYREDYLQRKECTK